MWGGRTPAGGAGLEVRGVTVRFGGLVALNAVDLSVPAGGRRCGDRTERFRQARRCSTRLPGWLQADSGVIRFDGADLTGLRRIGYWSAALPGLFRTSGCSAIFRCWITF